MSKLTQKDLLLNLVWERVNLSWYRATFLCSRKPAEYHLVMYSCQRNQRTWGIWDLKRVYCPFGEHSGCLRVGGLFFYSQKCFHWRGDFSLCRSVSGTVPMNCLPDSAHMLHQWLTHTLYLKAENKSLGKSLEQTSLDQIPHTLVEWYS